LRSESPCGAGQGQLVEADEAGEGARPFGEFCPTAVGQRCRSIDVQPSQSLNELIEVERAPVLGADRVTELGYAVASAHEMGNRRAMPQPY
jgi:hypothetical protein